VLEDDEVSGDVLVAEAGVALVAVGWFRVELAMKMIERRLGYMHASTPIKSITTCR